MIEQFVPLVGILSAAEDTTAAVSEPDANATRSLAEILGFGRLLEAPWALQLISAAIAVVLALLLYACIKRAVRAGAQRNRGVAEFEYVIMRLLRWIYLPLAALFVLQQAGVQVASLWTLATAGLAMVAIGLVATWSMLSNVCATFMIFATRLFRVGDDIELLEPTGTDGLRGRAVDISLLFTTIDNEQHVTRVPNNVFFQKAVRVYRGSKGGTVEEIEAQGGDDSKGVGADLAEAEERTADGGHGS